MKALVTITFLLAYSIAGAQDWGAGIRLGDPTGITAKKYMEGSALEISIGRTHAFYGDGWYNNRFHYWYKNQNFGYNDYNYRGYSYSTPIAIQIHYLIHKPLKEAADKGISGLDWYIGFGGQLRSRTYRYSYRYKPAPGADWIHVNNERVNDIDLGIDGVLGLEYTFEEVPVSIFLDGTLFMEIFDAPFLFWPQAGIGARYRF